MPILRQRPASRRRMSRFAQPRAALLQRNLRGIKRDHAAGAQASRVGMNAVEIIEPELLDRSCRDRLRQTRAAPSAWAGCTSRPLCLEVAPLRLRRLPHKHPSQQFRRQNKSSCSKCRSLYEFSSAAHSTASSDSAISSREAGCGKFPAASRRRKMQLGLSLRALPAPTRRCRASSSSSMPASLWDA
jgi:hypothetical protein